MRVALFALPFVLLVACSQGTTEKAAAPADTPAPTMLGGVDLNQPVRALGTEPFWSVAITKDAIVYTGIARDEQRAGNPQSVLQGTTVVYTGATADGSSMVVTLIATECSDGMSDRVYPLTAKVELGEVSLNGCAASQAFIDTQPPA